MTREQIYGGVFSYFAALTSGGAPLFKTATRKPTTWDTVAPEDQPALLLMQRSETVIFQHGLPSRRQLSMALYVYAATGGQNDPNVVAAQVLNPLLDAIDQALTIDDLSNNKCTLGGLVSHAAIDGPIELYTGDLGDEAVAIIPVMVLVPA